MSLLITPRQLEQRAELYHQLAQLTASGIGLVPALEHLRRHPPAASLRESIRQTLDQLAQGYTFGEALLRSGGWTSAFDTALLQAGEHSGRLDACFKLLADYYRDRARLARQVIADLAYPAFVFHAAVFIFPFVGFFLSGNLLAYVGKTFGVLLPLYAGILLLIYICQGRHGEAWRAVIEKLLRPIPLLGTARHYLALARLAAALEALISAGVTIIEAWDLAAAASGSPALRATVRAWKPRLQSGQTPSEALSASRQFPELFANQYHTGEISGKLDETLRGMHKYYQEEGTRKLHAVAQWSPKLLYFGLMLLIAYKVISFWLGYFDQVNKAIGP